MEGIIVEPDARKDEDIVDFYADVFILVAKKYAKQQNKDLKIKLKDANTLLDKYDIRKFAMWMCNHGYCDTDIYSEDGVEEYLKEIE